MGWDGERDGNRDGILDGMRQFFRVGKGRCDVMGRGGIGLWDEMRWPGMRREMWRDGKKQTEI